MNEDPKSIFRYQSKVGAELVSISLVPYFFLVTSSVLFVNMLLSLCSILGITYNIEFILSFLIVILSFSYFYARLIIAGYEIPRRRHFIPFTAFSILVIFLSIIFLMFSVVH